jgi:hypothetical protein
VHYRLRSALGEQGLVHAFEQGPVDLPPGLGIEYSYDSAHD